jgi:hypothetical protein
LLDGEPEEVVEAALRGLRRVGSDRGLAILMHHLTTGPERLSLAALETLGEMEAPEALSPVLAALEHELPGVRTRAAALLVELCRIGRVDPAHALVSLLESADPDVRAAAKRVSANLREPPGAYWDRVLQVLRAEDWWLRERTKSGLVELGGTHLVRPLEAWLEAPCDVLRRFALSLLGAFEITIPSGILTSLDRASQGGGFAGTLLMGLTFSLTAFACVGPFVGTLLAASVSSGGARPLAGMVSFAGGLATPFFFLAVFPSYLKRMPRSGGWLERIKVVMGFLILAAMFKYLSSVDQVMQWNVLTRERFLAVWIVLFSLAGLYLLGFLRMHGVKPDEPLGLGRLLTGAALLMFAISLAPGMFGGRLGELDAYIPATADGARSGSAESGGISWMKNQYRDALARAREKN